MDARLKVVSGPYSGQTIQIPRGRVIVGREEDCQLRPQSRSVSRHHCVMVLDDDSLRIRDLGSKNGTLVNNSPIGTNETVICSGDIVSIGEMVCHIELLDVSSREGGSATSLAALKETGTSEGDVRPNEPTFDPRLSSAPAPIARPFVPHTPPFSSDNDASI